MQNMRKASMNGGFPLRFISGWIEGVFLIPPILFPVKNPLLRKNALSAFPYRPPPTLHGRPKHINGNSPLRHDDSNGNRWLRRRLSQKLIRWEAESADSWKTCKDYRQNLYGFPYGGSYRPPPTLHGRPKHINGNRFPPPLSFYNQK